MKKVSNLLLSLSVVSTALVGCSTSSSSTAATTSTSDKLTGTYAIHVEGYDWGAGVDKAILKLSNKVSNVDASDFTITETKQTTDWSDETFPIIVTTVDRVVENAYPCDENGEKVDGESEYVAFELYCSPNDGSPLLYSMATSYNTWSDPYYLTFALSEDSDLSVGDTTVTELTVDEDYTTKSTVADVMNVSTFKSSDGIEMKYGTYEPEEKSDTLFVWLHGAGEGGVEDTDPYLTALGNKVTAYFSEDFQETLGGANVLVPQCPTFWMDIDGKVNWQNNDGTSYYEDALMELIDSYKEEVGAKNVVVAGCSNGGFMTMRLILSNPDYFTAAVPICEAMKDEYVTDEELEGIKDLPIYFIYSEDDTTVDPTTYEKPTIKRLEKLGASNLHVSTTEHVIDTSGKYDELNDGEPYQYNGHWSWIYFDNNEADCDEHGEQVWQWIADQLN